jgi:hypothetical protein
MTVKITAALAKQTTKPVWDSAVNGFCLWPYEGGARSFLLFYRVSGRSRQITIGAFPTWSVEAARLEAKALRRLIDQGRDPAQEKRERREAPTIRDLIDRYITDHLPTKSRSRERDERRMLEEIGQHLGLDSQVAEIHFGDIEEMHRKITASGRPVRANRILTVANKAFALALKPRAGEARAWRDPVQGNPCKGVGRNRETARERFYSTAEIAAITDALAEYGIGGGDPASRRPNPQQIASD